MTAIMIQSLTKDGEMIFSRRKVIRVSSNFVPQFASRMSFSSGERLFSAGIFSAITVLIVL